MKDDQLEDLLRDLPREVASENFTQSVVARVRANHRAVRRPWTGRLVLATAAALGLVILPFTFHRWQENRQQAETRQRVELLRNEYRALEEELEELMRLRAESQPIVTLGEDERFDFVLDLRDLARPRGDPNSRPVVYRPGGRR